jgi:hypothetical protein
MLPRVTGARHTGDYRLELTFTDGARGEVDLRDWIVGAGGVFSALEDPRYFQQVRVNSEVGTIEWPNGVDLCPDVLYSRVTGKPISIAAVDASSPARGQPA